MYKRLYTFLNNNNIFYNLQFGFRQQYSTSHALINITGNIRKAIDDGNIGCGVFVKLLTLDHQILLAKLNHYGIHGVSNDWFKSYLSNWSQYVASTNESDSGLAAINCGLLCLGNSIRKLNKLVSADLKHLVNWLNANKISLNLKKTEMVIFKSKQKKFEGDLKVKLSGKRLYPTESVKYLGVEIDTNLSWQYHGNDLSVKLNRANALLFKMRKYVSCIM